MVSSFCEQVGVLCNYLKSNHVNVSYERIGAIFRKSKQSVHDQYKIVFEELFLTELPSSLIDAEISIISEYISKLITNANRTVYPSFDDIDEFILINFIHNSFGKMYKICVDKPMELSRLESSIDEIENNLNNLEELILNIPAKFIFNLDEVRYRDFADAEEKRVIIPIEYDALVDLMPC